MTIPADTPTDRPQVSDLSIALILARFDTQDRRFDTQDKVLERVLHEVKRTNGRVTALEGNEEKAKLLATERARVAEDLAVKRSRVREAVVDRHRRVEQAAVVLGSAMVGGSAGAIGHALGWW